MRRGIALGCLGLAIVASGFAVWTAVAAGDAGCGGGGSLAEYRLCQLEADMNTLQQQIRWVMVGVFSNLIGAIIAMGKALVKRHMADLP